MYVKLTPSYISISILFYFILFYSIEGNAIASLVSRLRLERNFIVLKLNNLYAEDSDDDEEDSPQKANSNSNSGRLRVVEVEVDLTMSAYANVTRMYGHKKVAQAKEIKTLQV